MVKSVGNTSKKKAIKKLDTSLDDLTDNPIEEDRIEDEIVGENSIIDDIPENITESSGLTNGNLEELPGVGPTIAEKLGEAGYNTYEAISVASPKELSAATGIGEATAQKVILSARSKLNIGFMTAEKLFDERKKISRLTTGSEKLDGLLGGGIETRSMAEFYGEFRTGKTQIAHQLCITVQLPLESGGLDGSALFVDSEGTFRPERLLQIAARYNLDVKKVLQNVFYARAYNSDHQIVIIDTSPKLIQEKNVKLIIVDSVMSHFRAEYIGRGTLSERQQKLNKFIHKLLRIAEAYNVAIFITNQVMDSPGVFFGDPTRPVGGHILAHSSTYRIYLRKSKGSKRVARLIDSPCLPEGEALFEITENGIEDP
ncbi:MAG: DNA repair and recombination protein RadA [Candidatus Helarchaeota archaeon]|nr:DNA repair and recombination protein RadA [Candidatus Helarchaeota archaeon]